MKEEMKNIMKKEKLQNIAPIKILNSLREIKKLLEIMLEEGAKGERKIIEEFEGKKDIINNALEEHNFSPKKREYLKGKREGFQIAIKKIEKER